jgi:N-methylhydantoinase A
LVTQTARELSAELTLGAGRDTGEISVHYALAIRFQGQEHALWIAAPNPGTAVPADIGTRMQNAFDAEYLRRYGHVDELSLREVVELEVVAERALPPVEIRYEEPPAGGRTVHESLWGDGDRLQTPVIPRSSLSPGDKLTGPAVLFEIGSTTAIPPGATAVVQDSGAILIHVKGSFQK